MGLILFHNEVYVDITLAFGQIQIKKSLLIDYYLWLYLSARSEVKAYMPPQKGIKVKEIHALCVGQIAAMKSLSPKNAKIKFIGK